MKMAWERSVSAGGWLVFVGLWLQAVELSLFGLNFSNSWPVFLIAAGAILIVQSLFGSAGFERRAHRNEERPRKMAWERSVGAGGWLIFVGLWLLAVKLSLFGLTFSNSWPLFLVAAGAILILQSLYESTGDERRAHRNGERS